MKSVPQSPSSFSFSTNTPRSFFPPSPTSTSSTPSRTFFSSTPSTPRSTSAINSSPQFTLRKGVTPCKVDAGIIKVKNSVEKYYSSSVISSLPSIPPLPEDLSISFTEIVTKKKRVKAYCLSDLHVDAEKNFDWVLKKCRRKEEDRKVFTVLIVPGDVASDLDKLERIFRFLKKEYDVVTFLPGNHELWVKFKSKLSESGGSGNGAGVSTALTHPESPSANSSNSFFNPSFSSPYLHTPSPKSSPYLSSPSPRSSPFITSPKFSTPSGSSAYSNGDSFNKFQQILEVAKKCDVLFGPVRISMASSSSSTASSITIPSSTSSLSSKNSNSTFISPVLTSKSIQMDYPSCPPSVSSKIGQKVFTFSGDENNSSSSIFDTSSISTSETLSSSSFQLQLDETNSLKVLSSKSFDFNSPLNSILKKDSDLTLNDSNSPTSSVVKSTSFSLSSGISRNKKNLMIEIEDNEVANDEINYFFDKKKDYEKKSSNASLMTINSRQTIIYYSDDDEEDEELNLEKKKKEERRRRRLERKLNYLSDEEEEEDDDDSDSDEEIIHNDNDIFLDSTFQTDLNTLSISSTTTQPSTSSTQPSSSGLLLFPLYSWYHYDWDQEEDIKNPKFIQYEQHFPFHKKWSDFGCCKWPSAFENPNSSSNSSIISNYTNETLSEAFGSLNEPFLYSLNDCENKEEIYTKGTPLSKENDTIISYSHFLPRQELILKKKYLLEPNLTKVIGSFYLESQIRRLSPSLHLFGHSHIPVSLTLDDIDYLQWPLGYTRESERQCEKIFNEGPLLVYDSVGRNNKIEKDQNNEENKVKLGIAKDIFSIRKDMNLNMFYKAESTDADSEEDLSPWLMDRIESALKFVNNLSEVQPAPTLNTSTSSSNLLPPRFERNQSSSDANKDKSTLYLDLFCITSPSHSSNSSSIASSNSPNLSTSSSPSSTFSNSPLNSRSPPKPSKQNITPQSPSTSSSSSPSLTSSIRLPQSPSISMSRPRNLKSVPSSYF